MPKKTARKAISKGFDPSRGQVMANIVEMYD